MTNEWWNRMQPKRVVQVSAGRRERVIETRRRTGAAPGVQHAPGPPPPHPPPHTHLNPSSGLLLMEAHRFQAT